MSESIKDEWNFYIYSLYISKTSLAPPIDDLIWNFRLVPFPAQFRFGHGNVKHAINDHGRNRYAIIATGQSDQSLKKDGQEMERDPAGMWTNCRNRDRLALFQSGSGHAGTGNAEVRDIDAITRREEFFLKNKKLKFKKKSNMKKERKWEVGGGRREGEEQRWKPNGKKSVSILTDPYTEKGVEVDGSVASLDLLNHKRIVFLSGPKGILKNPDDSPTPPPAKKSWQILKVHWQSNPKKSRNLTGEFWKSWKFHQRILTNLETVENNPEKSWYIVNWSVKFLIKFRNWPTKSRKILKIYKRVD